MARTSSSKTHASDNDASSYSYSQEPVSDNVTAQTKLYRSETDRMLGGVCGGIAHYFSIDSTLVRLVFLLLFLFGGSGILLYIVLWIIIPNASSVNLSAEDNARKNINEIRERANELGSSIRTGSGSDRSICGALNGLERQILFQILHDHES